MVRALLLATVILANPRPTGGQTLGTLHIKVVLVDAERKATPVAKHALLISDNPTTAPPRRVVTAMDGTADVKLPPGNYTVESDRPVAFQGQAYEWTTMVDVAAGRDTVLELTAGNAEVGPLTPAMTTSPAESHASAQLTQWQDSVVALWTPTAHASGFVADANGLIVTNQRVIGTATSVEVQLAPDVKVAGTVLAADAVRDVAVVRIDPAVLQARQPLPLGCALPAPRSTLAFGVSLLTILAATVLGCARRPVAR